MPDALITQLLQTYGALGGVVIAFGLALRSLQAQLTAVQDRRIADAQASTAKLLELVAAQHEHQALLARAIDGNADAIQALRGVVESLAVDRGYNRMPSNPRR